MADLTTLATTLGREATAKARAFADTNPVAKKAKDAVFTAVGFGVMGTQKATAAVKNAQEGVDDNAAAESVKRSVSDVASTVKRQVAVIDEALTKTVKSFDEAVAPYEEKLPTAVRELAAKVRALTAKFVSFVPDASSESSSPESDETK